MEFYLDEGLLLCFLLLITIYFNIKKNYNNSYLYTLFRKAIFCTMLIVLFDAFWDLIQFDDKLNIPNILGYLYNIIYYYITSCGVLYYNFFVDFLRNNKLTSKRKFLYMIPLVILMILVLLSYNYNVIFYLDELGIFHRGSLHFFNTILTYGVILFQSFIMIHKAYDKTEHVDKKLYIIIALYPLIPMAFYGFQFLIPNIRTMDIGLTFALVMIYIRLQNLEVTTDSLTGLKNKYKLIKDINFLIEIKENEVQIERFKVFKKLNKKIRLDDKNDFYLVMFDLDNFKHINDVFGHVEGDKVIEFFGNSLDELDYIYGSTSYRYGGDEFICIFHNMPEKSVKDFIEDLEKKLVMYNDIINNKYQLATSYGYLKYNTSYGFYKEFIEEVDKKLYESKKLKKKKG